MAVYKSVDANMILECGAWLCQEKQRSKGSGGTDMDTESSDMWPQHLEELGDRSNQESDRVGFMRIMNRNHLFNSSNYSLSSLFSLGSVGGSVASGSASRPGSTRSKRTPHQLWQGPACLGALYQLLIAPFEDALPSSCTKTSTSLPHSKGCGGRRELLLVLEGELYLVPFPLLKPNGSSNDSIEYLCERFSLLIVPSLTSLRNNQKLARAASKLSSNASIGGTMDQSQQNMNMSALVVGNPSVPCSVTEQWGWDAIPYAEQEAAMVAEMLQAKALVTSQFKLWSAESICVDFHMLGSVHDVVNKIVTTQLCSIPLKERTFKMPRKTTQVEVVLEPAIPAVDLPEETAALLEPAFMAVEYPEETAALLVPAVTAIELPEETATPLEPT
ncbi:unnamed protein product, partial [Timema podura]|nr:unnamed protein product [Timema podura]